jgi:hypothetical protein
MDTQHITTPEGLKNAIGLLQIKQAEELAILKNEFLETVEQLKPINLLKSSFREFTASPSYKDDMLGATVGITAGLVSKVLAVGLAPSPLKKILGSFLQSGVSKIVSANFASIKLAGSHVTNFFSKKENAEEFNKDSGNASQ